jgi:hypothetical protein
VRGFDGLKQVLLGEGGCRGRPLFFQKDIDDRDHRGHGTGRFVELFDVVAQEPVLDEISRVPAGGFLISGPIFCKASGFEEL